MRIRHLILPALTLVGLFSCADHSGSPPIAEGQNPPPPISGPDTRVADPGAVATTPTAPQPGSSGSGGSGGSGGAGGTGPGGGSGGGGGGGGGPGGGGPGGGGGGAPVPEPGTMLLVGTGLAGAALYRRRRKTQQEA